MAETDTRILMDHLGALHTTELGKRRMQRNLSLNIEDMVHWCREQMIDPGAVINRVGKNWYIEVNNCRITVNASSYTIITAHRISQTGDNHRGKIDNIWQQTSEDDLQSKRIWSQQLKH